MSVSLAEIVAAARGGAASFVAESAGYIVLALADGALRSFRTSSAALDAWTARLDEQGDLIAGGPGRMDSEEAVEQGLRQLLAELLRSVRTPSPNLQRVANRDGATGLAHLVVELEAALVPVNRKAARRSLARLCRETRRAIERGLEAAPSLRGDEDLPRPVAEPTMASQPRERHLVSECAQGAPEDGVVSAAGDAVAELAIDVVFEDGCGVPDAPPAALDFTALLSPVPQPAAARDTYAPEPAAPVERSAAPSVLPFAAETPEPILAAAARPESAVPARPAPVEPLELTGAAPPVAARPAAFEVPPLEVEASAAEEQEGREETPTRIWAPVVLEDAPRDEWEDPRSWAAELAEGDEAPCEETSVDWTVAEQTEVTAPYEPLEEVAAVREEESTSAVDTTSRPAVGSAAPPPLRLSRRPPSDVAELLARHGWARKTDEAELFEGLGRLASLERSLG